MSTHCEGTLMGQGRLHALDVIRSWPEESRKPASWVIHVHREPDKVSESELVWEAVGPWQRIVAMREFHAREWPVPHTASVRSVIRYHVPPDRDAVLDDLDLAIEVDRDRGSVATVGPDLRTNLLAFNLMHDVVTGTLDVGQARRRYADLTTAPPSEHPTPDMVKCRFDDQAPTEPRPVPPSDRDDQDHDDQDLTVGRDRSKSGLGHPGPDDPAADERPSSSDFIHPGVHEAMPSPQPGAEPESEKDTDGVTERRRTRRHGRDVDEAAERSSGFDLDEDTAGRDRSE